MSELKPCPFCGNIGSFWSTDQCQTLYATCIFCGVRTVDCDTPEEAITAWNTRPNNWVSVEERLPELGDTVLAYIMHDTEVYGRDDGFRAYRVYEYDGHFIGMGNLCKATHWQPLPEPPKGE